MSTPGPGATLTKRKIMLLEDIICFLIYFVKSWLGSELNIFISINRLILTEGKTNIHAIHYLVLV